MKGYMITSRTSGELPKTIATAKIMRRKKVNHERIKQAIDAIKMVMQYEQNPVFKERLAEAGLILNKVMISNP